MDTDISQATSDSQVNKIDPSPPQHLLHKNIRAIIRFHVTILLLLPWTESYSTIGTNNEVHSLL